MNSYIYQNWIIRIIKCYILLMVFFLPQEYTMYTLYLCTIIVIGIYLYGKYLSKHILKVSKRSIILWVGLLAIILFNVNFSEYPTDRMIQNTCQLLIATFLMENGAIGKKTKVDCFFWLFSFLLFIRILMCYINGKALSFTNFADSNYAAIIVFLYLTYSIKIRRLIGVIIAILFGLITDSRLYIILLVMSLTIGLLDRILHNEKRQKIFYAYKKIINILLAFLVASILISIIWSYEIVGTNTVAYEQGINDTSNAIRTNSNLYALQLLTKDINLIWRGYDVEIRDVLGISSSILEQHTRFMGYRIVQPHNSFINPLITHGIIYSILYFAILASTLSKCINNKNKALWLPYMCGGIFMHSLFSGFYLIFWGLCLVNYNQDLLLIGEINHEKNTSGYTSKGRVKRSAK